MTLNDVELGKEYIIKAVETGGDEEMESFLFSLGCYSGEAITLISERILWYPLRMQDIILILNLHLLYLCKLVQQIVKTRLRVLRAGFGSALADEFLTESVHILAERLQ